MEDISKQQQIFKSLFNQRSWSEVPENANNIFEQLQILLKNIADKNSRERLLNSAIDDAANTPLHIVAIEGNIKLAKLFVEYGANIDVLNGEGNTPDQLAKKANLSLVGRFFNSIGITKYPNSIEVYKYLNNEKLKKNQQMSADNNSNLNADDDELSPEQIGQEVQKALRNLKKSNNEQDYLEHLARIDNYLDNHGAQEQAKREIFNFPIDSNGNAAIHYAAELGYLKAVKFLHDNKKVDVNIKNKYGNTPLHASSANEYNDISDYLLRNGADIDSANKAGITPLHYALAKGKMISARFLLEAGADTKKTDNSANTPLHYAAIEGDAEIIEKILSRELFVDEKNELGNTALFTAVINENAGAVKSLITNNAALNIKNNSGKTPLDYAKTDEIKTLLKVREE